VVQATGLRDSSMLTQDENIVDIRFTVQYRLKDARAFLFENRNPDEAVVQASESAVREIVGAATSMTRCCTSARRWPPTCEASFQAQLDRLKAGIVVANVNVQACRCPTQVQAAFNDAVKATADRDRFKNEGQAYASDVIPQGSRHGVAAARRGRGLPRARGRAGRRRCERFRSVLAEYQKAPAVTRDRLYIETMQQVYLQRQQGAGRQPRRLQPAVPAAGQADAAGRRRGGGGRAGRCRPRRRPRRRPTLPGRATARRSRDREGADESPHESNRNARRRRWSR
jgi:HflK protein